MKTIREPARDVPVVCEVDVLVVGGGATGVFAAVAAARRGLSVAICEQHGFFGGMATAALVAVWHSLHDVNGEQQIIGGLTAEVLNRLRSRGALGGHDGTDYAMNTEELKIELDRLVVDAGVRPFLHAFYVGAISENGRPVVAVIEDKSGRRAIRARFFVDSTGDGDLLRDSGLPCERWDDIQPPTACVRFAGLQELRRRNPDMRLGSLVYDTEIPGHLPRGFIWGTDIPGLPDDHMIAGTRVSGADCSDADQLTRAEIEGRRQVRAMHDIIRSQVEGGAKVGISALGACIGIRETRHARCLHRLTEEEVLSGTRFDDAIGNATYRVDIHHSDRPGLTFRFLDGRELYVVPGREPERGRWREESDDSPRFYQIPYRCLVPQGAENVLATGRLIDADRGAYGAVRVMVNCNQTGEAAGTACALACERDCSVPDVDPQALRRSLADGGAIVL